MVTAPMLAAGLAAGVAISVFQTVVDSGQCAAFIPAPPPSSRFALTFPWMLRVVTGFDCAHQSASDLVCGDRLHPICVVWPAAVRASTMLVADCAAAGFRVASALAVAFGRSRRLSLPRNRRWCS